MEVKQGTITGIMARGFGYIRPHDSEEEIFFHAKAVCSPTFEELREGMEVNYCLVNYKKKGESRTKAIGVVSV